MLKCKEIVELVSNSFETSIPWPKRWQMKLHLLMCKTCDQYYKQLLFIQKAAAKMDSHFKNASLSSTACNRIQEKIKDVLK